MLKKDKILIFVPLFPFRLEFPGLCLALKRICHFHMRLNVISLFQAFVITDELFQWELFKLPPDEQFRWRHS